MKIGKPLAAIVLISGLAAACNIAVDKPLGVSPDAQFVAPGDTIKGRVINPGGAVSVALQNSVTNEQTTCTYSSGKKTFACPTSTDAEGLYVVGVTDAGHPDDGTKKARIAVTGLSNYSPQVSVQDKAKRGEDVAVSLLTWGAERTVTVNVLDKSGATVFTGKTRTARDGGGKVTVKGLSAGSYTLQVADRLWTAGVADAGPELRLTVSD